MRDEPPGLVTADLPAEHEAVAPSAAGDDDREALLRGLVEGDADGAADDLEALPVPDDDRDRLIGTLLGRRVAEAEQRADLVHRPTRRRGLETRPLPGGGISDVHLGTRQPRVVRASRERRRQRRLDDDDQVLALLRLSERQRRAGQQLVVDRGRRTGAHEHCTEKHDAETHHP